MRRLISLVMLLAVPASILSAQEQTELRAYADSVEQLGDRALGASRGGTQYLDTGVEKVQLAARFAAVTPPEGFADLHEKLAHAAKRYAAEAQKTGAIPLHGIDQCWSRHSANVSQTCESLVNRGDPHDRQAQTAAQAYVMARRELRDRMLAHGVELPKE